AVVQSQAQLLAVAIAVPRRLRHTVTHGLEAMPLCFDLTEVVLNTPQLIQVVAGQHRIVEMLLDELARELQGLVIPVRSCIGQVMTVYHLARRRVEQAEPAAGNDAV